jgi:hypothetical protein
MRKVPKRSAEKPVNPVWFGHDAKGLYDQLVTAGLTCRSFKDFCKDAFYDAVDAARARGKKESGANAGTTDTAQSAVQHG